MNKRAKFVSIIFIVLLIIFMSSNVYATEIKDVLLPIEFSDEFKAYMNLSDEEKEKVMEPRAFDIINTRYQTKNPFRLLGAARASETKYTLKDVIPENVKVKDQKTSGICWAFSSLASLETNLALKNYNNNLPAKVYDFSETHMDYSFVRIFANQVINPNGLNRKPGDMGNWNMATAYLANGYGAVKEEEMPFDDSKNIIDIKEIQNKNVVTELYDTIDFPTYNPTVDNISEIKTQMKEHIKNNGSVGVAIHGAEIVSDYYNNETGALYCDDKEKCPMDHAVSIIGWDDNYSKDNFVEAHRPKNNGAWIAKNSWGERIEYTLAEAKEVLFNEYKEDFISMGYNKAEDLPNEGTIKSFEEIGYLSDGKVIYMPIGDNGLIYISYEDINVYYMPFGIINAAEGTSYDNVYYYDETGISISAPLSVSKMYLANVFSKKEQGDEYITRVGLYATETYTCKVYVNPNGTSKAKKDLQEVKLKAGNSETFNAGFHTIEFLEPVKITGNQFVIVIEILGTRDNVISFGAEAKIENSNYSEVNLETDKCFFTIEEAYKLDAWEDLSKINELNENYYNADSTIKVYTTSKIDPTPGDGDDNKPDPTPGDGDDNNKPDPTPGDGDDDNKPDPTPGDGDDNNKPDPTPGDKDDNKPNPDDDVEKAQSSDFSKAKTDIKKVRLYTFSDKSKESYELIDVEVNGISRKYGNDNYEYSYYLSDSPNEKNIEKWIKIKEEQNSSSKLIFTINPDESNNYADLLKAKDIYIYVKETVSKGNDEKSTISYAMKLETTKNSIEEYVDGVKKVEGNKPDVSSGNQEKPDDTTLNGELPFTGLSSIIIIIIGITLIGIVAFIRFEIINKDLK